MRPHLSPEMLAKRAQFKHNTIQTEDGVFSAVSLCFFSIMRNSYIWNISVHGSTYTCVVFMNACMSKITMMWLEAVSKATAGSIEVNSMCHDKPNDCTNHTQVSNMHTCVCTWNREDSDQLLFWQELLLSPVDVLSVKWKPQLADRNLSNQVRHRCISFLEQPLWL